MRHLKRFKNWLAVLYYACWTYSQQFRTQSVKDDKSESHEPAANLVASDDSSSSALTSSPVEVPNKRSEPVETAPAIPPSVEVKKPSSPEPRVISKQEVSPKPAAVSLKVEAPQVAAKPKSNGATSPVIEQQTPDAKYQPGAINDQTAQRLARLLVSEIKLYYKSKSESDTTIDTANIYDLLKDPIEKSRKHYNQRMGQRALDSMPDYFHGELVRTLCGGDASRLGPNYPAGKGA